MILDALVQIYQADIGEDEGDEERHPGDGVTKLVKAGVLTESYRFMSPIAERFYYDKVCRRTSFRTDIPVSLEELHVIVRATQSILARRLGVRSSTKDGVVQSPKQTVSKQLFHEAVTSLLPVSYRIIPPCKRQSTAC